VEVKIGHGGTLDPLATGVLVAGIGKGTKHLLSFLECTKTYETIILFGAETDTYDRLGKIVRRAGYEHITHDVVEEALEKFRGKIMQRPPIFSALRVQGKKLYEYAREGIEPPIEIKSRPVEVHDLRILEWYEPGTHEYKWPVEEMVGEEKAVAEKMLDKDASVPVASEADAEAETENTASSLKRKSPPPPGSPDITGEKEAASSPKKAKTTGKVEEPNQSENTTTTTAEEPKDDPPKQENTLAASPPAVKITMTVSSGFYVRSLAHDLGKAVGSCGLMSSLVRSRQGEYVLEHDRILEYEDLERGEEVWGPKVRHFLEEWQTKHPAA
jgi:tRNA pseudouridine55 synthase